MNPPILYRKRLIPDECIRLDRDTVLECSEDILITAWQAIHPRKDLARGISAFFWKEGVKVSKFYDHQNRLICWYCDIITHDYDSETNTYVMTDLLADVLLFPDGRIQVVDLDELADAVEQGLITEELMLASLRRLNDLLQKIYQGQFHEYQSYIEQVEEAQRTA